MDYAAYSLVPDFQRKSVLGRMQRRGRLAAGISLLAMAMTQPSPAFGENVPGIHQLSQDAIAINLYEVEANDNPAVFGATETASNDGGHALAEAFILCADEISCPFPGGIVQFARGEETGSNTLAVDGVLTIGAAAVAEGASATAAAIIHRGLWQVAAAEGAAENDLNVDEMFAISANAEAVAATGSAVAFAGIAAAVSQIATGLAPGAMAQNQVENLGTISIVAQANAQALMLDAAATVEIDAAIFQGAEGPSSAISNISNSGLLEVVADAQAVAPEGMALGSAAASGIIQFAVARSESFASSVTAGGLLVGVSTNSPSGPAAASISNSGTISIEVEAGALGDEFAAAIGGVFGVSQNATGDDAQAVIENDGSIDIVASAEAESNGYTKGVVFVSGITQSATALAQSTVETIDPNGVLTLEISSTPQGAAEASLVNTGTISVLGQVDVLSNGTGTTQEAQGVAFVDGLDQYVMGESAQALVENSGSLTVIASVSAEAENIANPVVIATGIDQSASAYASMVTAVFASGTTTPTSVNHHSTAVGPAMVELDNSGTLTVLAEAESHGGMVAYAGVTASAVGQGASGTEALAFISNSGSISAIGNISSNGPTAYGGVAAIGLQQGAQATISAEVGLENSGDLSVIATGEAVGEAGAFINATAFGVAQNVASGGSGVASIVNSGSMDIGAIATANAGAESAFDMAMAFADAHGIGQLAQAEEALVRFDNGGEFHLLAQVEAVAEEFALASATAWPAVQQFAIATTSGQAQASFSNSGELAVGALAVAEAESTAIAMAILSSALSQSVLAGSSGSAAISNSGSIELLANAQALANGGELSNSAMAQAMVVGVNQALFASETAEEAAIGFSNQGSIDVGALAHASGDGQAQAFATAAGYFATGSGAHAEIVNLGSFSVSASALAEGATAEAEALAMGIVANGATEGSLSGTIHNLGQLTVGARAETRDTGEANAKAVGVSIGTGTGTMAVSNSGTIDIWAITNGGTGQATGIELSQSEVADAGNNLTITNDGGTIVARVSDDGGQTWRRGTSIDTRASLSASTINLVGDGSIYGNIELSGGDRINVEDGETWFDGSIKTDCPTGACAASILNIDQGGALFLRHASTGMDGPSAVFVDELDIGAEGTIIFELPADDNALASYPQVFAGIANLEGTLLVRSSGGLFADSMSFEDVIDAAIRVGEFDRCGIDGNSALLRLSCSYDDAGNVDLSIERVAFDAVDGLTRNETAVGRGIEAVYDIGLEGPFAEMVEQLFGFDADGYAEALDQLGGASHAAYLQSFHSLGVQQNLLIDKATNCELPDEPVSSFACRTDGRVHMWGQLDFSNRRNDGDREAPGYDGDRWTTVIGADVSVGTGGLLGASFAKLSNDLSFRGLGGTKAEGYQLGLYGTVDSGKFYAKVISTIGWYDGDSSRNIDWTGMGGTLAGTLKGDADARLWTLGGHFGYRLPLGDTSVLTPFVNVDYSKAKLKGFTETGLAGAELKVEKSTSSQAQVTLGARWAGDVGNVAPQVELGYTRMFGDRRSSFDASFAAEEGSDFSIVSASQKRGSLFSSISLGGKAGPLDIRIGYQGLFDGDAASHSGNLRLILPLGKQ